MKKNIHNEALEISQHELIENAQKRIKVKKALYWHFAIFLVGSLFMVIANHVLNFWETYNWSIWAMTLWGFILCVHAINVFIINPFLGKDWERKQRERLVALQKRKLEKLGKQVEQEFSSNTKS